MEYKEIIPNLLKSTNRKGIDNLIEFLNTSDFYSAPASHAYHGNFEGGLIIHSHMVYKIYSKLVDTFKRNIPQDSIVLCGLLHDICKVSFYKSTTKWKKDESNKWLNYIGYEIDDVEPLGHGCKSVIILNRFIELTDIEIYSILYHMGIPEDFSTKKSFNKALELYPDAIMLHLADFMSSTIYEKKVEV